MKYFTISIIIVLSIYLVLYSLIKPNIVKIYTTEQFISELNDNRKKTLVFVNGIYLDNIDLTVPKNIKLQVPAFWALSGSGSITIEHEEDHGIVDIFYPYQKATH